MFNLQHPDCKPGDMYSVTLLGKGLMSGTATPKRRKSARVVLRKKLPTKETILLQAAQWWHQHGSSDLKKNVVRSKALSSPLVGGEHLIFALYILVQAPSENHIGTVVFIEMDKKSCELWSHELSCVSASQHMSLTVKQRQAAKYVDGQHVGAVLQGQTAKSQIWRKHLGCPQAVELRILEVETGPWKMSFQNGHFPLPGLLEKVYFVSPLWRHKEGFWQILNTNRLLVFDFPP